MTVLVTGAAGFIGHQVAKTLMQRGEDVIGIDCINDYYDPALKHARLADIAICNSGNFEFIKVDFADHINLINALKDKKFDSIVHLGAQPGVRYSIENPRAYIESNVVGHLNMLELARHRGVDHMVYASSSSVYGLNKKTPFAVDDRVDHPISLYAATKKSDELVSETYAHLYCIPLTGLRFFTVYGPWGRPDMAVWKFTSKILNGESIGIYNQGDMRRDFTYIDDIVAGVIATLDNPPTNDGSVKPGGSVAAHNIYNIGNNRPEELGKLIETIEHACGRDAVKNYLPMQAGDVYETYADISAISKAVGYKPTTGIDVGIPKFVQWYKKYMNL